MLLELIPLKLTIGDMFSLFLLWLYISLLYYIPLELALIVLFAFTSVLLNHKLSYRDLFKKGLCYSSIFHILCIGLFATQEFEFMWSSAGIVIDISGIFLANLLAYILAVNPDSLKNLVNLDWFYEEH